MAGSTSSTDCWLVSPIASWEVCDVVLVVDVLSTTLLAASSCSMGRSLNVGGAVTGLVFV